MIPALHEKDIAWLKQLRRDLDDLILWKQGIQVTGALAWSNPSTGLQIVIGQPKQHAPASPYAETVMVRVTSTLAGGGFYSGSIYGGSLTVSGSSTVTLPSGGLTTSAGTLVLNTSEAGTSTHNLSLDSWHVGKLVGGNSSGPIVAVNPGGSDIPLGTTQYQVYQMLNTTVAGWDFVRSHS